MIRHGDTNEVQEIGKYLEDGCERIKLATGNRTAGPAEERMKERKKGCVFIFGMQWKGSFCW